MVASGAGVGPGRDAAGIELRDGPSWPPRRAGRERQPAPAEPPPTFEEALRRLDEVVARLEGGEVGLEEAVALFEQGQGYLAACRERLAAAQRRIEELTADELAARGPPAAPRRSPTRRSEPPPRAGRQRSRRLRSRSMRLSGTWQPAPATLA